MVLTNGERVYEHRGHRTWRCELPAPHDQGDLALFFGICKPIMPSISTIKSGFGSFCSCLSGFESDESICSSRLENSAP